MIETIQIKNVQKHQAKQIDLDPGLTVLTGPSGSGKTAILRGLELTALNRPAGNGCVRHDKPWARIRIKVDGHKVSRKKGKARNSYHLDGKILKAFGADVPQEVAKLLNVGPENFQGQHDTPFLLSLSPGQAARELNSVIDLGIIDSVLAASASESRQAKAELEVGKSRLETAQEKQRSLAWIRDLDRDLKALESKEEVIQGITKTARDLENLVLEGKRVGQTLDRLAVKAVECRRAVQAGSLAAELDREAGQLRGILSSITRAEAETCQLRKASSDARAKLASVNRCPICGTAIQ